MKPLKIVMQAFGPYPGREVVDFEDLSKAGIFLIKGPTGSGKTTIFDAMSMALYGKSTGEEEKNRGGRNNLEVWRCNQADWDTETLVEFTFKAGDNIYQFARRLVPKRTKLDIVYAVNIMDEDGVFQPMYEKTDAGRMNEKAEELIGLNGSQFRQVVLLPQGQFERFLVANSDEKAQILCRLFDAGRWNEYANRFYNKVNEKCTALYREKQAVDASLHEENEELTSIEDFRSYIETMNDKLIQLENSYREFDYEGKCKQLEYDRELAGKFARLNELEATRVQLISEAGTVEGKTAELARANKAEKNREQINLVMNSAVDCEEREKAVNRLQKVTKDYEKAESDSKKALDEHMSNSIVDECNAQIAVLNSKAATYAEIDIIRSEYIEAEAEYKKIEEQYNLKNEEYNRLLVDVTGKLKKRNEADAVATDYRNRYFAGIYGEIASTFSEGEPCPVCGSTNHPNPASRIEGSVSKEDMEAAEADASECENLWVTAEESRKKCELELNDIKTSLEASNNKKTQASTKCEEASKNLVEGIADSSELQAKVSKLQRQIDEYNVASDTLKKEYEKNHDDYRAHLEKVNVSIEELNNSRKKYNEQKEILDKALLSDGYDSIEAAKADLHSEEERSELQQYITSYATKVEKNSEEIGQQKQLVEGFECPDSAGFEDRKKEIDTEHDNYLSLKATYDRDLGRLKNKCDDLDSRMKYYNENIQQAESDLAFAKKLRGDSGIGLERYVLGIMFNQIISEANRMLHMVHNGRYQLYRTDEKGAGNKRGLELLVHDDRKPEESGRPVSSLSGGEKFLVSLSLSIGMSAIAQQSGLHIEALFIDEGFGTLDERSIADAMSILECVQKSNGMIGIISHVSILENNIPKHIEIVKTEKGSSIKMC